MAAIPLRDRYLACIECCNAHRFDDLTEFLAPTMRTAAGDIVPGEHIARLDRLHASFAGIHWRPLDVVTEGVTVAARLLVSARHTGAYAGIAPSGRESSWAEGAFSTWSDGRMTSCFSLGEDLRTMLN
ncbi:ester cyclase [Naasia lichenicola]|uniref:Ester cyclase n=1 Tax=Naasia lichenicola TaxID=2565933 RepID=A0A4S4FN30_9MICO|nr:ester cyclase [Naasia lichenicola]THG31849.1 ester cyclase [Naasia lichenicola]